MGPLARWGARWASQGGPSQASRSLAPQALASWLVWASLGCSDAPHLLCIVHIFSLQAPCFFWSQTAFSPGQPARMGNCVAELDIKRKECAKNRVGQSDLWYGGIECRLRKLQVWGGDCPDNQGNQGNISACSQVRAIMWLALALALTSSSL